MRSNNSELTATGTSRLDPGGDAAGILGCLDRLEAQLRRAYLESTRTLVAAVEARDAFTHEHSARVTQICRGIGRHMRVPTAEIERIATAAQLHDIGKIGVPDAILNNPGPLTDTEFAIVRRHPSIGVQILGHTTYLRNELPYILHHHERVDGGGYPYGLKGAQIPFGARLLAVADALDAMLSQRSYKAPLTLAQARMELVFSRGRQFDADVVDGTLSWLDDVDDALAVRMRTGAMAT